MYPGGSNTLTHTHACMPDEAKLIHSNVCQTKQHTHVCKMEQHTHNYMPFEATHTHTRMYVKRSNTHTHIYARRSSKHIHTCIYQAIHTSKMRHKVSFLVEFRWFEFSFPFLRLVALPRLKSFGISTICRRENRWIYNIFKGISTM